MVGLLSANWTAWMGQVIQTFAYADLILEEVSGRAAELISLAGPTHFE